MEKSLKDNLNNLIIQETIYKGFVNLKHIELPELINFFNSYSLSYIICGEYGSQKHQEHFHFIFTTNVLMDTLKKSLIKKFPELKREGKGGEHRYTISIPKVTKKDLGKSMLSLEDQKLLQLCYTCKDLNGTNKPTTLKFTNEDAYQMKEEYFNLIQKNLQLWKDKAKKKAEEDKTILQKHIEALTVQYTAIGADGKSQPLKIHQTQINEYLLNFYMKNYRFKDAYQIAKEARYIKNFFSTKAKDNYLLQISEIQKNNLSI